MIRFRFLVLGVLVCSGAVGVASADPFAWERSPDPAALAAACAPVAGKPVPSLPLLMDVLVPLEELVAALQPVDLVRWREQFYLRNGDRLDLLDATGITRWYVAQEAGALLTAEGKNTLVQRDLQTLKWPGVSSCAASTQCLGSSCVGLITTLGFAYSIPGGL